MFYRCSSKNPDGTLFGEWQKQLMGVVSMNSSNTDDDDDDGNDSLSNVLQYLTGRRSSGGGTLLPLKDTTTDATIRDATRWRDKLIGDFTSSVGRHLRKNN